MNTIEVIDLISSPDPQPPRPKARELVSLNPHTGLSNLAAATSPRPVFPRNGKINDDWYLLSDESSPPRTQEPMNSKPTREIVTSAPVKDSIEDFGNDDFWSIENIRPTIINKNDGMTEKPIPGNDFFYLSGDFDSTITLDESHLPVIVRTIMKRKLSPDQEQSLDAEPKRVDLKGANVIRAVSDVDVGSKGGHSYLGVMKASEFRRTKTMVVEDDPIVFTSSADIDRAANEKREKSRLEIDRELRDDPILLTSSPDIVKTAIERRERAGWEKAKGLDEYCNDSLDRDTFGQTINRCLSKDSYSGLQSNAITKREATYIDQSSSELDLPDLITMTSQISTSAMPKMSRVDSDKVLARYNAEKEAARKVLDRDQKARMKGLKAQERLESKEAEKEKRRLAKEDKAAEKRMATDLAKLNQKRTEKKTSSREMIVDLPKELDKLVAKQIGRYLEPLGADCQEWNSAIPNVIRWRRKVEARYNEELGHWEPTPEHIQTEKQVMCVMGAKEFVDLVCGNEGQDIDAHVMKMKACFHEFTIMYLIEGLVLWQRKNKNIKNRQFVDAVRNQINDGIETASSNRRLKKKQPEHVDADMIEDALLNLQVMHGALIHHAAAPAETAECVFVFTQHISTAPYRLQEMTLDTAFCMDAGQVKTGDNAVDTFIKMLQEVNRITAPIAYGIAAEYPSAQKLVTGFEKHGKTMLQHLKKTANKDGALTDREIGIRISNRVYSIFMGEDERSTDV